MKRSLPLILAFIVSSCMTSQRTMYLKAPSPGKRDTVNVAAYEQKYGNYPGVYLDMDESCEHSGSNVLGMPSWEFHYIVREKILVLNPDDQDLTTFHLSASRQADIGTLYIRVTSPDGTTAEYGLKDLVKEQASKDLVRYKFIPPNIVKGSVFERAFELSYDATRWRPRMGDEIPLQFHIPCERVSYSFAYPDWWTIRTKSIGVRDTVPYSLSHDSAHSKMTLSCVVHNVAAVKEEPYAPYFKEVAKYLEFMVTSFRMAEFAYTSPSSWSALVDRYKDRLTENEGRGLFSSRVQEMTEKLIQGKTTDLDKLTAILDYVQTSIENTRDNKVRDFADVLKDKEGDDYELTGLTNMMLRKAGLRTQFLMVHSAEEGYFDTTYVSFRQLSIPAIAARAGNQEYILVPYHKDMSYEDIPDALQGQLCVVVSGDSAGTFRTIPSSSGRKNIIAERFNLNIDEKGLITVAEEKTIGGRYATTLRQRSEPKSQSEKDKFFKDLISYSEGQVKISSYALENEKDYRKPLVIKYSYTIDNLVTLAPDEVLFHTAGLFAPASLKDFRVDSEERDNPIRIYNDDEYAKEITLRYPDTWEVKTVPPGQDVENMFGSLKVEVRNEGHVMTVKQARSLRRMSQPRESIGDLVRLAGSKSNAMLPTLVFSRRP